MSTRHSQFTKALLLILVFPFLVLAGCAKDEPTIDPMPSDIDQDYLNPEIQKQQLYVKGAVQSGIVTDLDDYSPFIIFSVPDGDFRAYLTEQGVSEAEFLASPNLRAFYEAHVIGNAPGLLDRVYEAEAAVEVETLSGQMITLESRDDEFGNGVLFINEQKTEGAINENNTNYDFILADRPIIDFPIE